MPSEGGLGSDPRAPSDVVQDRLIDAAERLVALHTDEGTSSRAIIAAAGQRHNSAITYHFGDRRGLLDAVWERRSAVVNRRRLELIATWSDREPELRQLVLLDLLEQIEQRICDGSEGSIRTSTAVRMVISAFAAWERDAEADRQTISADDLGVVMVECVLGLLERCCPDQAATEVSPRGR